MSGLQFQLLGIGVEVSLEIGNGHTVGVRIVDTQSATHVDVLNTDAMTDKLLLQLVYAIAECLEIAHIQYLRTNMEVQAYKFYVLHLLGLANHLYHIAHSDAELVLGQSGGDVSVGVGTHIGIQTESHASHLALLGCQLVDNLELGDALYVKTEDVVVQSKFDFPIALTYTSINDFLLREACLD